MNTPTILPGRATAAATRTYAHTRGRDLAFAPLQTGWHVSCAGFGGYRITSGIDEHAAALTHALQSGINLIDTSANYADGGSEQLIGQVLHTAVTEGHLEREQVVVVTKAGYLQGENLARSRERAAAGTPWPDLIDIAPGVQHCIHPAFLSDQIARSLRRLRLATVDVLLLHNPEYALGRLAQNGVAPDAARREFMRRLRLAFDFLEQQTAAGRIQCYGISANTFGAPADAADALPLSDLAALRQTHPGFKLIQLPLNLFEPGAVLEQNATRPDGRGASALELAHALALDVLANRPLNAIHNGTLRRLADVPRPERTPGGAEVSTAVDTLVAHESRLRADILPALALDERSAQQLLEQLGVGLLLHGRWPGFGTYQNWHDVMAQFILPRVRGALRFLSNAENSPQELSTWVETYQQALGDALALVDDFYRAQGAAEAQVVAATAALADPDWWAPTLSQTAVRAVRSTAGVTAVLVGMRRSAYVDDVLADLARPVAQQPRLAGWQTLQDELRVLDNLGQS